VSSLENTTASAGGRWPRGYESTPFRTLPGRRIISRHGKHRFHVVRPEAHGPWHKRTLLAFLVIVLAHWRASGASLSGVCVGVAAAPGAGVLGQTFPWLIHSEVLHYGYALIMLVGIWTLLPGFVRRSTNVVLAPTEAGQQRPEPTSMIRAYP